MGRYSSDPSMRIRVQKTIYEESKINLYAMTKVPYQGRNLGCIVTIRLVVLFERVFSS